MLIKTAGWMLLVVAFNAGGIGLLLRLPPAAGLLWVLGLGAAFLWWHLRRNGDWPRRKHVLRLRRPSADFLWIALGCGSSVLLALGVSGFIERYAPPSSLDDLGPWEAIFAYRETAVGAVALWILVVAVVPTVEEFCFRGRIQHMLEGRFSPALAIGVTSVLFMMAHLGGPHWSFLFISLTIGISTGVGVYLFNSIWIAVAIHGAWNGLIGILHAVHSDLTTLFGPMRPGSLTILSVILLLLGVLGWSLLLRAGRRWVTKSDDLEEEQALQEAMTLPGEAPPP